MILITGATGQYGGKVLDHVLENIHPSELGVLVRNADKAAKLKSKGVEVRIGDYNDYDSLEEAFKGVRQLFFVSGSELENRSNQHKNVVEAAQNAGVSHVIYTSFQRKNNTETSPIAMLASSHIDTENWLMESDMNYTLLRHNLYMEGLPMFLGDNVLESGKIFLPAGDGKAAFATRSDMAEAGAKVLSGEGHENKIYEISNATAVGFEEISAILSDIAGKNIEYISPDVETFKGELAKAGLPEMQINFATGFATAIKEGEFNFPDTQLEALLGRKPTRVEDFLRRLYGQ